MNGKLFPEVHAFGTLIKSTKVFRLIICNTLQAGKTDTVKIRLMKTYYSNI